MQRNCYLKLIRTNETPKEGDVFELLNCVDLTTKVRYCDSVSDNGLIRWGGIFYQEYEPKDCKKVLPILTFEAPIEAGDRVLYQDKDGNDAIGVCDWRDGDILHLKDSTVIKASECEYIIATSGLFTENQKSSVIGEELIKDGDMVILECEFKGYDLNRHIATVPKLENGFLNFSILVKV